MLRGLDVFLRFASIVGLVLFAVYALLASSGSPKFAFDYWVALSSMMGVLVYMFTNRDFVISTKMRYRVCTALVALSLAMPVWSIVAYDAKESLTKFLNLSLLAFSATITTLFVMRVRALHAANTKSTWH